jgi:hypothetical protein
MNTRTFLLPSVNLTFATVIALSAGPLAGSASAAAQSRNPVSKIYFSDIGGDAQIDTGDMVEDVQKRSVYTAQGTVIETKSRSDNEDNRKVFSTMVFSNGTGAFFDEDTRVEVRRFVQEPFIPNHSDMNVEPSISQTQAFLARGSVGLCNSKLVAGSNMTYSTPHGSVNIRGQKIVIDAAPNETVISMIEGDGTVRAGNMDMGGARAPVRSTGGHPLSRGRAAKYDRNSPDPRRPNAHPQQ